jgi:hypothetical protein
MKQINEEIKRIQDLSDFDKRNQLKGYGFKICLFLKQFYKIEDKEYKKAYCFMSSQLDKEYKKAYKNLKVFNVEIEIKNKRGVVFNYNENYEERNEEEVLKRIKERKFFNYYSRNYNEIKNPIFNKIEIKEILKNG